MAKDAFVPARLLQQQGGMEERAWITQGRHLEPAKATGREGELLRLRRHSSPWRDSVTCLRISLLTWFETNLQARPQLPKLCVTFTAPLLCCPRGVQQMLDWQKRVRARFKSLHRGCICLTWINLLICQTGRPGCPRYLQVSQPQPRKHKKGQCSI